MASQRKHYDGLVDKQSLLSNLGVQLFLSYLKEIANLVLPLYFKQAWVAATAGQSIVLWPVWRLCRGIICVFCWKAIRRERGSLGSQTRCRCGSDKSLDVMKILLVGGVILRLNKASVKASHWWRRGKLNLPSAVTGLVPLRAHL